MRAIGLLGLLVLTGCPTDPPRGPASLIDHGLWREADRLWHDGFFFATDEPVHLALRIGDEQVWDVFLDAPGNALNFIELSRVGPAWEAE